MRQQGSSCFSVTNNGEGLWPLVSLAGWPKEKNPESSFSSDIKVELHASDSSWKRFSSISNYSIFWLLWIVRTSCYPNICFSIPYFVFLIVRFAWTSFIAWLPPFLGWFLFRIALKEIIYFIIQILQKYKVSIMQWNKHNKW